MRFIYVDEAGISAKEPVIVVVGVMVEADTKWKEVAQEISETFDKMVPHQFREGFIFHGTDVYSGGKYRSEWEFSDRLEFFKAFLAIPIRMKLPMSISMLDRRYGSDWLTLGELPKEKMEHLLVHQMCVARADKFLRVHLNPSELGVVIAEDTPGMKRYFKKIHEGLRLSPIEFTSEMLQDYSGNQTGETLSIINIIDCPHFVDKSDSVMIQMSDALAFAFRRYFSGLKHGDDLIYSTFGQRDAGKMFNKEKWGKPISSQLIGFN